VQIAAIKRCAKTFPWRWRNVLGSLAYYATYATHFNIFIFLFYLSIMTIVRTSTIKQNSFILMVTSSQVFGGRCTLLDQFHLCVCLEHPEHCKNGDRPIVTMGSQQEVVPRLLSGPISDPIRALLHPKLGFATPIGRIVGLPYFVVVSVLS